MLNELVERLIEVASIRSECEKKIKEVSAPLKAALAAALGPLPATLTEAKDLESEARAELRDEYLTAYRARNAALLEGIETPPIDLGPVGIRWVSEWIVIDPDKIPREFLAVDWAAVREAGGCPGVAETKVPSFTVKATAPSGAATAPNGAKEGV